MIDHVRSILSPGHNVNGGSPYMHLADPYVYLADASLALGDLDRARHHLSRTLKLDATNREALRYAALLAERELHSQ